MIRPSYRFNLQCAPEKTKLAEKTSRLIKTSQIIKYNYKLIS